MNTKAPAVVRSTTGADLVRTTEAVRTRTFIVRFCRVGFKEPTDDLSQLRGELPQVWAQS